MDEMQSVEIITVTTNHWRVPSEENAFNGWIEGAPSQDLRQKILQDVRISRSAWTPSEEALALMERIRSWSGSYVRIQFWSPIMNMLEEEGPYPLRAKLIGIAMHEEDGFHQAYMLLSEVQEIPNADGCTAMNFFKTSADSNLTASLADLYRIEKLGDSLSAPALGESTQSPLVLSERSSTEVEINNPSKEVEIKCDSRKISARGSFDFDVSISDIEGGINQMRKNGQNDAWMVFLAETPILSQTTRDCGLALQYSVINGKLGLDWVLLGERNAVDAERIIRYVKVKGHQIRRLSVNGVDFLRVEDGNLAVLGFEIFSDLYGVKQDAQLGLIINGIWLSAGKRSG